MSHSRNSRRDFLNKLCCLAAGGGAAAMIPQLHMMGTALANSKSLAAGYKALVCVYLSGGNDSWNMLVPFDAARFQVYSDARSGTYNAQTNSGGLGLSLPTAGTQTTQQKIIDGKDASPTTNQYFLNSSFTAQNTANQTGASLKDLYDQHKLAFLANVGTLVAPINMADYNASSANRPPQLYSHADQTNQWHQASTSTSTNAGWGGLCAENLLGQGAYPVGAAAPLVPLAISIAGANRFVVGSSTVPYQMSSNGLTSLKGVCNPTCTGGANSNGARDTALNDLLAESYASDFADGYDKVFTSGRALYTKVGPHVPPGSTQYVPSIPTTWPAGSLASQLKTVATMINLSKQAGYANRQIYFVQLGGFDLHSGFYAANNGHAALLAQVSSALSAFWTALGPTGANAQSEVTAFTVSDFARTLQSNGAGSDHAWGSMQMVLGGAVNGGKLYSNGDKIHGFPDQHLGGTGSPATNNFSRGQMIPAVGVEQYAATLAQWMGVSVADCATIFPNLHNFTTKNLGFV